MTSDTGIDPAMTRRAFYTASLVPLMTVAVMLLGTAFADPIRAAAILGSSIKEILL